MRMLMISGRSLRTGRQVRRMVLRFTGSRRMTRAIIGRIEAAMNAGPIQSCVVLLTSAGEWDVQFSMAGEGGT